MTLPADAKLIAALAAACVLALFILSRRGVASATGSALGSAAVGLADGAVSGVVKGVGGVFGIPDTSETECARALSEGRYWDASFACPAKDFLGAVFSSEPAPPPPMPLGLPSFDGLDIDYAQQRALENPVY